MTEPDSARSRLLQGLLSLVGMPVLVALVYYLWICVRFHGGGLVLPSTDDLQSIPAPTAESVAIFTVWLFLQIALQVFAPGRWVEGSALADGSRLRYCMNG